jgi:hypothetical protein
MLQFIGHNISENADVDILSCPLRLPKLYIPLHTRLLVRAEALTAQCASSDNTVCIFRDTGSKFQSLLEQLFLVSVLSGSCITSMHSVEERL